MTYKILQISYNLCFAYITSCFFYFVTVIMKEKRDKRNIYPHIYELNKQIINCGSCVFTTIVKAAKKQSSEYDKKTISEEDYIVLCKQVDMNYCSNIDDGLKHIGCKSTGYEITDDIYNDSILNVKQLIKSVLAFSPHLETDLIKMLNDIGISKLQQNSFKFESVISHAPNEFIIDIAKDMYDYLTLINQLEEYNKQLGKYNKK